LKTPVNLITHFIHQDNTRLSKLANLTGLNTGGALVEVKLAADPCCEEIFEDHVYTQPI